jgi:membrane associated rhomboid family serine protease
MLMIPLSLDVRMRQLPFANGFLIALTVAAYVAIGPASALQSHPFVLERGSLGGLLGHIWMHADVMHLAGNMLFLWVFGNAVCSRMGNFWYPLVYVGLGVMAGIAHTMMDPHQAVGASGAINGVVGMALVLFPAHRLKMLYSVAYAYGNISKIPAYSMIVLWFIFDVYGATAGGGHIAYWAHLGGFAAGVVAAAVMLRASWVRMFADEQSLPQILKLPWNIVVEEVRMPDLPPVPRNPYARGSEKAELTGEPLLDEAPAPERPAAPPPAASGFKPWRAPGDAIRLRCLCGANVLCLPRQAGHTVHCPACGREVAVLPRHEQKGPPR